MKKFFHCILISLVLILTSCGEDRSGEYEALIVEDKWIEGVMRDVYLWYYDIPDASTLDFFATPENFFKTLLSKKGQGKADNYSYIKLSNAETRSISTESSYGFDYIYYQSKTNSKQYFARVIYVLPDSPASEGGLKRGDWISRVNETQLDRDNYGYLLQGEATKFTTALLDTVKGVNVWTDSEIINIPASREVEDNPFYVDTVYTIDNHKIGYLMYNSFTTSLYDQPEDQDYNNQMRKIFADFKSSNLTNFILDLRYNPGGYLSCAQVLSSLLAPEENLGDVFCSLLYNNKHFAWNDTLNLEVSLTGGANINQKEMYVIVSNLTASSSETVINCLQPYMKVTLIGTRTEGKNVASQPFSTELYPSFTLHPIVAFVNNSRGESDFYEGMKPDYEYDEQNIIDPLLPLGDTKEYLLKKTLSLIINGSGGEEGEAIKRRSSDQLPAKPVYNSLERKKRNGVLLAPREYKLVVE